MSEWRGGGKWERGMGNGEWGMGKMEMEMGEGCDERAVLWGWIGGCGGCGGLGCILMRSW